MMACFKPKTLAALANALPQQPVHLIPPFNAKCVFMQQCGLSILLTVGMRSCCVMHITNHKKKTLHYFLAHYVAD